MEIGSEKIADTTVLTLAGRLDAATAPALERELQVLLERGERRLLLDCTGLKYVSSAGLSVFLVAGQCLHNRDGSLSFCCLGSNLGEIFAMTDLARLFAVFPTRAEALAQVQKGN